MNATTTKTETMSTSTNTDKLCDRVTILYRCMHVNKHLYSVCGAHKDDASVNLSCYNKRPTQYREEEPNLVMGSKGCSDECEALSLGWFCCTCGSKYVTGFVHEIAHLPVHVAKDANGDEMHVFCEECKVFESRTASANANMSAGVNPDRDVTRAWGLAQEQERVDADDHDHGHRRRRSSAQQREHTRERGEVRPLVRRPGRW